MWEVFFFFFLRRSWLQIVLRSYGDMMLKTFGPFMSPAQTVTRQRAEHEKWRDCIYPAYSAPAHVHFFFFFSLHSRWRAVITRRGKTSSGMKGNTETWQQLQTLFQHFIFSSFWASTVIFTLNSCVDLFLWSFSSGLESSHDFPQLRVSSDQPSKTKTVTQNNSFAWYSESLHQSLVIQFNASHLVF